MRLQVHCSICLRPLTLISGLNLSETETLNEYKCGHSFISEKAQPIHLPPESFVSCTQSKNAFKYQEEGIEFILNSDFNVLLADPMGLGKTIQALLAARANGFKRILVVVKSATLYQWVTEIKEWYSPDLWSVFIIQGSKGFIPPGFKIYLISMDTLGRMIKFDDSEKDYYQTYGNTFGTSSQRKAEVDPRLKELNFDLIIVDECHSFKNPEAKRSAALVNFIATCGIKHKILLSGTPIKNRADEYFIPLNLLRPDVFSSLRKFRRDWLMQDLNGKWSRISPYMLEEFKEVTKDFIIRREKAQVLDFLPPFRRTFETVYVDDEDMKKAYNVELERLREKTEGRQYTYFDIEGSLMTLRRITGMMKVSFATEYVDTFLETTEDEKIAIGVHHKAVRDTLYNNLSKRGFAPLKISGEDNPESKERTKNIFVQDDSRRVLIVQMLAGGVGLNLQTKKCCTMLGLEREWNAADEEQFEGRFYGRANIETMPLSFLSEYMLVQNSIDWKFHHMVEHKRQICGETLDGWEFTSDIDALRELVESTIGEKL